MILYSASNLCNSALLSIFRPAVSLLITGCTCVSVRTAASDFGDRVNTQRQAGGGVGKPSAGFSITLVSMLPLIAAAS